MNVIWIHITMPLQDIPGMISMIVSANRHTPRRHPYLDAALRLMWSATFAAFFITATAYSRQKHFAQVAVKSSYEARSLVRSEISQFLPDLRCWEVNFAKFLIWEELGQDIGIFGRTKTVVQTGYIHMNSDQGRMAKCFSVAFNYHFFWLLAYA